MKPPGQPTAPPPPGTLPPHHHHHHTSPITLLSASPTTPPRNACMLPRSEAPPLPCFDLCLAPWRVSPHPCIDYWEHQMSKSSCRLPHYLRRQPGQPRRTSQFHELGGASHSPAASTSLPSPTPQTLVSFPVTVTAHSLQTCARCQVTYV